eukprot:CAMPEP_0170777964 /NCGR_PEP_ID=MMETSP0733-20121128/12103_1 /TAXON_ID=186038 /ORGANISM="Fragilariopsis kerguelensis, Strain L26-C5" /LENGTH=75 /DNA_ID=CAMNT_0011121285 /DNA_START=4 /DNA_END=231 /DNA_ORIENTATION=-
MKFTLAVVALCFSGVAAFAPAPMGRATTLTFSEPPKTGAGGMADTRDPAAKDDEDPRKSISEAPSFEEYLKSRES